MDFGNGSISRISGCTFLFVVVLLSCSLTSTEAYDSLDPNRNITIKWDIMSWTPDGYVAVVTIFNFQQYRHIQAPGWTLGWTWAKKEVIWSMVGAQTTEQGVCSRFKGNIPRCCKKDPTVVDLPPGTPYNQQIANCCKGGVISSWGQDPRNAVSAFQVSVGVAGTSNKTVKLPRSRREKNNSSFNDMECYLHIIPISVPENHWSMVNCGNFMHGLMKVNIQVNRKVLSELCMHEPYSFKALIDISRKLFPGNKPIAPKKEGLTLIL
ncbi:hypothetical protein H6P81_019843 [Aristolochia fimbriata]|uniref:Large ribosomal subunit protein bL20c n=1 Tax=Aristolochia fimbriata TaxID=158543 RepID=A0AAV7DTT8_ARIFI|nr:hypothetical protein H6P81_019843 [Aristolochia fimbriata]